VSISTRTRFEIIKRDGYRCRYCGANAVDVQLHVDHVIAVANGGTDDPTNLITACAKCNLGKSDVPLDESRIVAGVRTEDALEHAEQVRQYLAAQLEVERARQEILDYVTDCWRARMGHVGQAVGRALRAVIRKHPLERIIFAIDVTADKDIPGDVLESLKYFYGVLRKNAELPPPVAVQRVPEEERLIADMVDQLREHLTTLGTWCDQVSVTQMVGFARDFLTEHLNQLGDQIDCWRWSHARGSRFPTTGDVLLAWLEYRPSESDGEPVANT
jgi:hypothetical protein